VEDLPSASAIGDKGNLMGGLGGLFKVAPKVFGVRGNPCKLSKIATKWLAKTKLANHSYTVI